MQVKREHSAILLTFIKLPFALKTFVLSIFEWPLKTGFTVISESTVFDPDQARHSVRSDLDLNCSQSFQRMTLAGKELQYMSSDM